MERIKLNEVEYIEFKLLTSNNKKYNFLNKLINFKFSYKKSILDYIRYLFTDVNIYKDLIQSFLLKKRVSCFNYLELLGTDLTTEEKFNLIQFSKLNNFMTFEEYLLVKKIIKQEKIKEILEKELKLKNKKIQMLCSEICNNKKSKSITNKKKSNNYADDCVIDSVSRFDSVSNY